MMMTVYENEIVYRGPSVQDYITKCIEFLYRRTGFRFEKFQTPRYLQTLLDQLSFNRVPLTVWNSLLTAVLRIANKSRTIGQGAREFGALFVDVLAWFLKRLMKMGLIRFSIFLYAYNIHPIIGGIIGIIFCLIDYFLEELFDHFSSFIQSHLISAPYYRLFVGA